MSAKTIDITTVSEQEIKLAGFELYHKREMAVFTIKQCDEQLQMIENELAKRKHQQATAQETTKEDFLDNIKANNKDLAPML